MFQAMKVDIIYYKTNTDFELEFNLCGCCRMRLLTDKAQDKKGLVNNMARAVARSRVIIIAGALFGENGTLNTVSHAIGKTLCPIDNKLFGIAGDDEISIINGATPLVTPDGFFGGCIIESGPQSMILLTDNKNIRKSIMVSLVHPYIEELCAIELKSNAASVNDRPQKGTVNVTPTVPVVPSVSPIDVPDIPTNDITSDTPNPETDSENSIGETEEDIIPDEENNDIQEESNEVDVELPTEETAAENEPADTEEEPVSNPVSDDVKENELPLNTFTSEKDGTAVYGGMKYTTDEYTVSAEKLHIDRDEPDYTQYDDSDDDYDDELDEYDYEPHKSFFSSNLPILIIAVLLLIIIAILCYSIFYVPSKNGVSAMAYLEDTFRTLLGK